MISDLLCSLKGELWLWEHGERMLDAQREHFVQIKFLSLTTQMAKYTDG